MLLAAYICIALRCCLCTETLMQVQGIICLLLEGAVKQATMLQHPVASLLPHAALAASEAAAAAQWAAANPVGPSRPLFYSTRLACRLADIHATAAALLQPAALLPEPKKSAWLPLHCISISMCACLLVKHCHQLRSHPCAELLVGAAAFALVCVAGGAAAAARASLVSGGKVKEPSTMDAPEPWDSSVASLVALVDKLAATNKQEAAVLHQQLAVALEAAAVPQQRTELVEAACRQVARRPELGCACVCVCVACARACVRVCVRARVHVRACVRAFVRAFVRARVCVCGGGGNKCCCIMIAIVCCCVLMQMLHCTAAPNRRILCQLAGAVAPAALAASAAVLQPVGDASIAPAGQPRGRTKAAAAVVADAGSPRSSEGGSQVRAARAGGALVASPASTAAPSSDDRQQQQGCMLYEGVRRAACEGLDSFAEAFASIKAGVAAAVDKQAQSRAAHDYAAQPEMAESCAHQEFVVARTKHALGVA